MEIRTIGFAKWSAADFFSILRAHSVRRLIDTRLNNTSQLSGFAKRKDLTYFLRELVGAEYVHEPLLTPEPDDLRDYRNQLIDWAGYEERYVATLESRQVSVRLDRDLFTDGAVLLCSEHSPSHCHRRLAAEHLAAEWGECTIVHL
jgi:uncharacterized protein (DUF488 family)